MEIKKCYDNGGMILLYYEISIRIISDSNNKLVSNIQSETFPYILNQGLISNDEYEFKIRAYN